MRQEAAVTDPVESISSPGFREERHRVIFNCLAGLCNCKLTIKGPFIFYGMGGGAGGIWGGHAKKNYF